MKESDPRACVVFEGPEPVAQMVLGKLQSARIEAFLWGGHIAGELPLGNDGLNGFGSTRVVVKDGDAPEALRVLRESNPG